MVSCTRAILLVCITSLSFSTVSSQEQLPIEEAYRLAKENYPLLKSIDIYQAMAEKENDLVDLSRRPTVMLRGDASLQSEAIRIGNENSPIDISVPIYGVQAYGEVTYNLFDGGVSDVKKQINEINAIVNTQQVEVNLYPLKEQINKIYAGVDLGQKLMAVYSLTENDLLARQRSIQVAVDNGVALESEVKKMQVRLLQLENEKLQVVADITSAYSLLSVVLGKEVKVDTELELPSDMDVMRHLDINRPELKLFNDQQLTLQLQKEMIDVLDKPSISLFAQAGVGYPNKLNFTDVSISPFALGGVKASYKLLGQRDRSTKKQTLDLQSQLVDVQEETFRHNLSVEAARYQDEFQLLSEQIAKHVMIADLQSEILAQMKVQLDNGVITSTEYLIQSNEELRARQNIKISESHLAQKRLEYHTIFGTKY